MSDTSSWGVHDDVLLGCGGEYRAFGLPCVYWYQPSSDLAGESHPALHPAAGFRPLAVHLVQCNGCQLLQRFVYHPTQARIVDRRWVSPTLPITLTWLPPFDFGPLAPTYAEARAGLGAQHHRQSLVDCRRALEVIVEKPTTGRMTLSKAIDRHFRRTDPARAISHELRRLSNPAPHDGAPALPQTRIAKGTPAWEADAVIAFFHLESLITRKHFVPVLKRIHHSDRDWSELFERLSSAQPNLVLPFNQDDGGGAGGRD